MSTLEGSIAYPEVRPSSKVYKLPVTIASGQTTSNYLCINGAAVVGIEWPAAFTGATISFVDCTQNMDGVAATLDPSTATYIPYDDESGNLISVIKPATLPAKTKISPVTTAGLGPFIKLVSASAEGADRILYVNLRNIE
jgi:hypothetical protein